MFPGIGLIASGAYDVIVAGGVETMSDVPIRLNRNLRAMLLKMNKAKTPLQKLKLLATFSPSYLAPEVSEACFFSCSLPINSLVIFFYFFCVVASSCRIHIR